MQIKLWGRAMWPRVPIWLLEDHLPKIIMEMICLIFVNFQQQIMYLADYRRLAVRRGDGKIETTHMDEYVDSLLRDEQFCGVTLPRI